MLWIRDERLDLAELDRAYERCVVERRWKHDRHGAHAIERSDRDEEARSTRHEHADASSDADPRLVETAHDVVDASVRIAVCERATFPEEEGALRDRTCASLELQGRAGARVPVEPLEERELRELIAQRIEELPASSVASPRRFQRPNIVSTAAS